MSVEYSYDKKKIKINDNEFIVLEEKGEEGYRWIEVIFKSFDEEIFIGSYYTYNYGGNREWMEYNNETIVLLSQYIPSYLEIEDDDCEYDDSIRIIKLFDIKNRLFMEGSKANLLEYYNQQFKKDTQDKSGNIGFQKRLLVGRENKK